MSARSMTTLRMNNMSTRITLKDRPVIALDEYGCFVMVKGGTVFTAPMNADGTCDNESWHEVTDPAEGFLKAILFKE